MAFGEQQPEDMRATLAVSQEEARVGSSRMINLPGGRTTKVVVPAGIRDGQELRLPGQGLASTASGQPSGDLVLRISVVGSEKPRSLSNDHMTERSFSAPLGDTAPAGYASGQYAPALPVYPPPAFTPPDIVRGGMAGQPQPGGVPSSPGMGGHMSNPMYGQRWPSGPSYGQPGPTSAYSSQTPPPLKPKRGAATTVLIIVIVLVLIAGSGLIYYLGYYQPQQTHLIATQTAQAQTTATGQANARNTAQVVQATAQVAATGTAQAQATVQVYQNIYTQATSGTPIVSDPLSSPMLNPLWDITIGSTANGNCAFTQGSYHSIIPTPNYFKPCYALNTNYADFAFQVDLTIMQGDYGGVLLRANTAHNQFYLFRVGVDGSFDLYNYANDQGSQAARLLTGTSQVMKGLNQSNEITVVAQKTTMYFYLNRAYLGSTNDNSYASGEIGVFAESFKNPTDVAFSNAKVWKL